MSHTAVLKAIDILSETALVKTLESLIEQGLKASIKTGQMPRLWYQDQKDNKICDYVLNMQNNKMDVGFFKENDRFNILADTMFQDSMLEAKSKYTGNTDNEKLVHRLDKFLREYAKQATLEQAEKDGYEVESITENEEGELVLLLNVQG